MNRHSKTGKNFGAANENAGMISRILYRYNDADFALKLKAKFVLYLYLAAIFSAVISFIFVYMLQVKAAVPVGTEVYILFTQFLLALFFCLCLYLLIKGHFTFASHSLIIATLTGVWFVMFIDKGDLLTRVDSIVFIFAALTMLPLLLHNKSIVLVLYVASNMIIAIVYIQMKSPEMGVSNVAVLDFLVDTLIAFAFSGVVLFNIYRINRLSLERAEHDIRERNTAEAALAASEKKFREMTDLMPQVLFELNREGKFTYVNKFGYKLFGYTEDEVQSGLTIFQMIVPSDHEQAKEVISKLTSNEPSGGNYYTGVKKDGTQFPVLIYSSLIMENEKIAGYRGLLIDVTDKKQAELEIKQSRDEYESLVSNIPGVTYRCLPDSSRNILFISKEIQKLSGYQVDDFRPTGSLGLISIIHPEDQILVSETVDNAIMDRRAWDLEYRIVHKDGTTFWVYEKGRCIRNENDSIDYIIGFILDITSEKLAQKALKESEEKYRTLIQNMSEVVIVVDNDDRVLFVNKKFTETLGYTEGEVLGKIGYEIIVAPEHVEKVKEQNASRLENIVGQYELTLISKSGNRMEFLVSGAPLINAEGKHIGSIGSLTDITERKAAEAALRESEDRFKQLIDLNPYSIVMTDIHGRYMLVNSAFCSNMGCNAEDVIGKTGKELHLSLGQEYDEKYLELLKQNGRVDNYEAIIVNPQGVQFVVLLSSRIIQMHKQPVVISATVDITDRKIAEQELENYRVNLEHLVEQRTRELTDANEELLCTNNELIQQQEELQAALNDLHKAQQQLIESEKMASIGILAAGVAHEINNPLNYIQGGVTGLEDYLADIIPDKFDEVSPLIKGINNGVERASKIVTSLNHFSRVNETKSELCDIHSIIGHCLTMLENQMKHKILVQTNFTDEPLHIQANEGKLHQAFMNILTNSAQAITGSGSISITTEALHDASIIQIADSGHGISAENINRIFDPFFTTKAPGEGTGLGLAISYKFFQEIDGKLSYESIPGQGTTVKIILPRK